MVTKKCKVHGELAPEQIYSYVRNLNNGKQYVQVYCRACKNLQAQKWRYQNPEVARAIVHRGYMKAKERVKDKKYYKNYSKNLTDGYVRQIIHMIYKVPRNEIPMRAIEIKREAIKMKREGADSWQLVAKLDKIFGRKNKYESFR